MTFAGQQRGIGAVRLTFRPIPGGGGVRQHKERQKAPGGEWSTVCDFTYHPGPVTLAEAGKQRCANLESRQFDFWAGEWDVLGPKGRQLGQSRIEPAVGGCLLIENWTGAGGGSGKSFNFFDPSIKQWRQVWVAAGGWLNLQGGWREGAIRYAGESPRRGGTTQERLSFTPSPEGTVRRTAR
ncbi:MAG: hypothetical protein SGI92_26040 [Bryobacteraceae bacterium]|nr:hypothetical protein [Bryobacteraceae bacterium]